jgi:endonuclease/exonuclease/phosphatase family metal-dependent hydrolase
MHELRDRLRELNADILFLQEVQGEHSRHVLRYDNYPDLPQQEFIAEHNWPYHAYGQNAVYKEGHHGNAILSGYPIVRWENQDVSAHRFESRGLLHCEIAWPGMDFPLHCFCVHFGLFQRGRKMQFLALVERIKRLVEAEDPLIIAGDFNDWNNHASSFLAQELQVREVFDTGAGVPARSYPARLPLLRMDRIYVRGLSVNHSEVHAWKKISDHAALSASLVLP